LVITIIPSILYIVKQKWYIRNHWGSVGSNVCKLNIASIFDVKINGRKLTSLEKQGFQLYVQAFGSSDEPNVQEIINNYLMGEYSLFLMGCEKNNEVVSFAIIRTMGAIHHIEYLCVDASYRDHGLGSRLLTEIKNHYLKEYTVITLQCSDDLLGFYRKNGFELYSDETYWQDNMYNLMGISTMEIPDKEFFANMVCDRMNKEIWGKYS